MRRPALRCLFAAMLLTGCVSRVTTSDGRPMPPEPHEAPDVPDDARPNALVLQVGAKPLDSDGNGYPDQIAVQANLFARPHPAPIYADGTFVFKLYPFGVAVGDDATPLAEWRLEGARVEAGRTVGLFGRGYQFRLSLVEAGGDEYPLMATNLFGFFDPADGEPFRSSEACMVQIGKRLE